MFGYTVDSYADDLVFDNKIISYASLSTKLHINSYNIYGEKQRELSVVIDKDTNNLDLDIENMDIAPEQSLYDLLVLLDLKTTDENNPYPDIEETNVRVSTPSVGGGTRSCLGKNFKVYRINGTEKEEVSFDEDSYKVNFNINKLGKYIIYYDEYDEYVIKFYNDIPPQDIDNDEVYIS